MWLEGEERSRRFPETTLTAQKCGIVHPVKTEDPENGTLRNGPYVGNKYMGVPPPHPQDIWEDPPPSSAGDERTGVMLQIANKNASVKKKPEVNSCSVHFSPLRFSLHSLDLSDFADTSRK